jgi:hypothetical protein
MNTGKIAILSVILLLIGFYIVGYYAEEQYASLEEKPKILVTEEIEVLEKVTIEEVNDVVVVSLVEAIEEVSDVEVVEVKETIEAEKIDIDIDGVIVEVIDEASVIESEPEDIFATLIAEVIVENPNNIEIVEANRIAVIDDIEKPKVENIWRRIKKFNKTENNIINNIVNLANTIFAGPAKKEIVIEDNTKESLEKINFSYSNDLIANAIDWAEESIISTYNDISYAVPESFTNEVVSVESIEREGISYYKHAKLFINTLNIIGTNIIGFFENTIFIASDWVKDNIDLKRENRVLTDTLAESVDLTGVGDIDDSINKFEDFTASINNKHSRNLLTGMSVSFDWLFMKE